MSEHDNGGPALKPCPFCGGASRVYCNDNGNNEWIARCRNLLTCGHRGSAWLTEAEAINSWNRRAALAAPVAAPPVPSVPPADWINAVMEQAQVFASAWSLVGGRFDFGNGLAEAEAAKEELRAMLVATAQPAPAAVPADAPMKALRIIDRHSINTIKMNSRDRGDWAEDMAYVGKVAREAIAAAPQQAPAQGEKL